MFFFDVSEGAISGWNVSDPAELQVSVKPSKAKKKSSSKDSASDGEYEDIQTAAEMVKMKAFTNEQFSDNNCTLPKDDDKNFDCVFDEDSIKVRNSID